MPSARLLFSAAHGLDADDLKCRIEISVMVLMTMRTYASARHFTSLMLSEIMHR